MEDLLEIRRMMFIGGGFGFEDLDDDDKIELLNRIWDFVNHRISENNEKVDRC